MNKFGTPPYLEGSSRGDSRFSAFYAQIKSRDNQDINRIYQAAKVFKDGKPSTPGRLREGITHINKKEILNIYRGLWMLYFQENPELIEVLTNATGISDIYPVDGGVCQSEVLWSIREQYLLSK